MAIARSASLAFLGTITLLSVFGGCGGTVAGTGGGSTGGGSTGGGSTGGGGSGGGVDFTACDAPKQCVLTAANCCGSCGMPELPDVAAVNQTHLEEFQAIACSQPIPCPACPSAVNPNLFTYCDQGHCVAADARTHAVSACTQDSDCVLRFGMGCCESCQGSESDLTCVSPKGFQAMHHDLGCDSVACDFCIPIYPMFTEPLCTDGHCQVGLLN